MAPERCEDLVAQMGPGDGDRRVAGSHDVGVSQSETWVTADDLGEILLCRGEDDGGIPAHTTAALHIGHGSPPA